MTVNGFLKYCYWYVCEYDICILGDKPRRGTDNDPNLAVHIHTPLIWCPSRVADTPPLLPISRYGYCLFVADACLCSEVLQPGSSWSSSGSGSM